VGLHVSLEVRVRGAWGWGCLGLMVFVKWTCHALKLNVRSIWIGFVPRSSGDIDCFQVLLKAKFSMIVLRILRESQPLLSLANSRSYHPVS
jgi:hypothetical protein